MLLLYILITVFIYFAGKRKTNYSNINFSNNIRNTINLSPLRSCLIVRSNQFRTIERETNKKRVIFADDKGLDLARIKFVEVSSDTPPQWNDKFIEKVTGGLRTENKPKLDIWEPLFVQPAAVYMDFRSKLDSKCVSLENAIVKDGENGTQTLTGTIKVKNLMFHKEIYIRLTFNGWQTFNDILCTFVPSSVGPELPNSKKHDKFDTFSFSVKLPESGSGKSSRSIAFCVRYVSGDGSVGPIEEYWDNNDGENYKFKTAGTLSENDKGGDSQLPDGITHLDFEQWTKFASWHHLNNKGPYW